MRLPLLLLCALAAICQQGVAISQDEKATSPSPGTVVSDLNGPSGIAIQPETGVVFVAESGAGRIGRIVDGKLEDVIKGIHNDASAKDVADTLGKVSLAFVDKQTLVVGTGRTSSDDPGIRIFKLPDDAKQSLEYKTDAETKLVLAAAKDGAQADGRLGSLTLAKHALYAISSGDSGNGWVLRSELKGTKFGELERAIATKSKAVADSPMAISISPRGEILVSLAGEADSADDSQVAFYSAKTNELLLSLETGLSTIGAIGYSPKTGLLYATGVSRTDREQGGLFRLDSDTSGSGQRIKATKLANLDQPTAMAFDKAGAALITVRGSGGEGDDKAAGALIKVSGL